jgi:transcription elongation factor Elf1
MFMEIKKVKVEYTRPSKLGKPHTYTRTKSIAVLECDACNTVFERNIASMDSRRLVNHYHHVCPNCDAKRFAQKKGVERRKLWDTSVDSDLDIGRL